MKVNNICWSRFSASLRLWNSKLALGSITSIFNLGKNVRQWVDQLQFDQNKNDMACLLGLALKANI